MQNRITVVFVRMALVLSLAVLAMPSQAQIRLAVLPRLSAVEMNSMFTPLTEYLSRETGEKVTLIIPKDFDAFKAVIQSGQADLGFANSLVYVQLRKGVALDPLALSAEPKAGTRFRGVIIARTDSGIRNLQDLKGKRLIFVEKDSAAGHVFQMFLLSKAGFDPATDFTRLPFAKKHDNVTMAVFNKAADAGGIREDDLAKMKDKVDLSKIQIVAYTDYFPNWPLFASPGMDKDKAKRVRDALLKLRPGAADSAAVLGSAKLTGFVTVADKDYDKLREAARLAGVY
ncbi:MAG: phosphate/phosphite/phosphonate ABC transporter substrate-binding protein [Thermoanaerobaculia bacterium]